VAQLSGIVTERVTDAAYRALREAIITGEYHAGDRLDVNELASRLQVSRTPVKDALGLLAAQGLVAVEPRRGTFVRRLSARDVAETFEVRSVLEALAGEILVRAASEEQMSRLEDALTEVTRVDATTTSEEHDAANARFHGLLVDLSGNAVLRQLFDSLLVHVQITQLHRQSATWRARASQEAQEHRDIVLAIAARDATRATAAIRRHIERGKTSLMADIEGSEIPVPPRGG
jgi:DNA-binding GntR family transcriptional regulator